MPGAETTFRRPEILAPAGDWDCLRAAVENGADAVYFGLQGEFNARARATNFALETLPETMEYLRRRGVRGYVAFNTLLFEDELARAEDRLRRIAAAGADAVIVQDLGVARLAREVSPDLPIHASTQMTVTTAEGAEFARRCGCSRVILARELSVKEIERIHAATDMELEVFVHGALCVSYSGQCLTSEVWGGRSANRGECAQACRLPYDLVCDGGVRELGPVRYLISPKDLAAWDLLPELVKAGVCSFKIEGRLKTPEYVANVTATYRRALEETLAGGRPSLTAEEARDLEQSFSRGLSHGFLDGTNHQVLVEGRSPKKRGVYLGRVLRVDAAARAAVLALEAPVKRGDGIVFEGPDLEAGEEGGSVYDVREGARGAGEVELRFGRERGPDLAKVAPGARVFKTLDPALERRLRASFDGPAPQRRAPLRFRVAGRAGEPLRVEARDDRGHEIAVESAMPLVPAEKRPLGTEVLADQLGRLGGTIFELGGVDVEIEGAAMLPISELNRLRREIAERMEAERAKNPGYRVSDGALARLREKKGARHLFSSSPELSVLVRTQAQAEAAITAGVDRIYLDFLELTGLAKAVATIRGAGRKAIVATPRIAKPGEEAILAKLLALEPAGILARHLGALESIVEARAAGDARARGLLLIGDFSLNAANALTAAALLERGLDLLTPSFDLNVVQLLDMVAIAPPDRFEVVIHQYLPMFHMEHCVFSHLLSNGTDYTNCGRPCDRHEISLRDRTGRDSPILADVGCRNTVFNDRPQSAAEYLERFAAAGLRRYRVELLREDAAAARAVISLYQQALAGTIAPRRLFRELNAEGKFGVVGVTRGTLPVVR